MAQKKRISHRGTKTEPLFSLFAMARQKWNKWINCGNFMQRKKKSCGDDKSERNGGKTFPCSDVVFVFSLKQHLERT